MKPAVTGVIVAAAVIVAFIAGSQIEIVEEETPAEAVGDAVESVAESAEEAAEDAN